MIVGSDRHGSVSEPDCVTLLDKTWGQRQTIHKMTSRVSAEWINFNSRRHARASSIGPSFQEEQGRVICHKQAADERPLWQMSAEKWIKKTELICQP